MYEGLTEYLGGVLATRSGIWNEPIFSYRFATIWAEYHDARPGREWRDLEDTARSTAAQVDATETEAYGSELYPSLERVATVPARMDEVLKPMVSK